MKHSAHANNQTLTKIAQALGVSIERFFVPEPTDALADTAECLLLWSKIESEVGRQRALENLRKIAEEDAAQSDARSSCPRKT